MRLIVVATLKRPGRPDLAGLALALKPRGAVMRWLLDGGEALATVHRPLMPEQGETGRRLSHLLTTLAVARPAYHRPESDHLPLLP